MNAGPPGRRFWLALPEPPMYNAYHGVGSELCFTRDLSINTYSFS